MPPDHPTDKTALIDRLSQHGRLRTVPRPELEWLAEHGELHTLAPGEFFARTGDPRETHHLNIVLSGRLTGYVWRDRVRRKLRQTRSDDFAGVLPFSRMTHSTADIVADEACEMLQIDTRLFPELIRECPGVTAACVHSMLDRAQAMTEGQVHDEKMFSLGKLASGLAHELNNPAAAALRSVQALLLRQRELEAAAAALEDGVLSGPQREELRRMRAEWLAVPRLESSPLERAEREDGIATWLEAHGVDSVSAAPLADAGVVRDQLEALADAIPTPALAPAIAWTATSIEATALLAEIDSALKRIHGLIAAVKGFTQMDRPLVHEPTRIAPGMRDTISVMSPKARARSVAVEVDVPDELPPVRASAAELNQIWASLIDNAIDAAPTDSRVSVSGRAVGDHVVISVVDRGSGIPEAIRGLVFDPFFTTKPIGHGRGLGLDAARRIVLLMQGQIDFESVAGRTEFRVALPIDTGGSVGG